MAATATATHEEGAVAFSFALPVAGGPAPLARIGRAMSAAAALRAVGQNRTPEAVQVSAPLVGLSSVPDKFVGAVIAAYNAHHPLGLDPDAIWLKIAQAAGAYVQLNSEDPAVRGSLVAHDTGVIPLEVDADKHGIVLGAGSEQQRAASWASAVDAMVDLISARAAPGAVDAVFAVYSGTQQVHRTALGCTLMSLTQNYFEFSFSTLCGIPRVTLYGTPEDYAALVARTRRLALLLPGFGWFFERLMPTLVQLNEAAHGRPDADWWQRIVSVSKGSGAATITGWICHFVPFVQASPKAGGPLVRAGDRIALDVLGPSLQEAPFVYTTRGPDRAELPMSLVSGFMGVTQHPETHEVRPVVGWAVVHAKKEASSERSVVCGCDCCARF